MTDSVNKGLLAKAYRAVRERPTSLWSLGRQYATFQLAYLKRQLCGGRLPGVKLGANVRLQRNRSLLAERPAASIEIGAHAIIYEDAHLEAFGSGSIIIGESSVLGACHICSRYRIRIGRRFLCSWRVFIQDFDPHPLEPAARRRQVERMVSEFKPSFGTAPPAPAAPDAWDFPGAEIEIGDDVWVGAGSIILKGARIGAGCLVAAGAVVTRGEYPPRTLIGGNPARVLREIKEEN